MPGLKINYVAITCPTLTCYIALPSYGHTGQLLYGMHVYNYVVYKLWLLGVFNKYTT